MGSPCAFAGDYHDEVWGTPVTDSAELFAQLSLCTQQCGISWRIVWDKRMFYKEAFHGWDMRRVAAMSSDDIDQLCDRNGPWKGKVIQNRAKLGAIVHNAQQCVAIEASEAGGLSGYLWSFVNESDDTVNMCVDCSSDEYKRVFGCTSAYSDTLAAALKSQYKFKFLGSIVLQAFLLQNGLLNGHSIRCPKNPLCNVEAPRTVNGTKRRVSKTQEDNISRTSKRRVSRTAA